MTARLAVILVTAMLLGGCSDAGSALGVDGWFGKSKAPPLPGERQSVLRHQHRQLEADPELAKAAFSLPSPNRNGGWPQAGGLPEHAMGHPALPAQIREVWRASIGGGWMGERRILARPVVVDGRVFAMDSDCAVQALDESTGRSVWRVDLRPDDESGEGIGGGVAFAEGRLFAASGYGEVVALDPATGTIHWRKKVAGPVRSAPTISGGRVYVVTVDNQLVALAAGDGAPLWNHAGLLESAGILGSASPAVDAGVVIAPFSSGELVALRSENGRVVWSDSLAATRRVDALSNLAAIRGLPVADRGLVVAVSHSGRMVAIDGRSGSRVWEQEIGSIETPWVVGEHVFVVNQEADVVAMARRNGSVRWVSSLDRYQNPDSKSKPIAWSGPVLAGGRLWLVSSHGQMVAIAPETGKIGERLTLPDGATLAPVVANETLFVLTNGGTLVAYR